MTRRQFTAAAISTAIASGQSRPTTNLGAAAAGFPIRAGQARAAGTAFDLAEHCHNLGLGSFEIRWPTNAESVRALRGKLEAYGLRATADIPLPQNAGGVAAFDAAVAGAKEAGIYSLHAAMTQRRYEEFDTFDAFRKNFERCQSVVSLAEPVLRRHRTRLGIENHKGWRAAEQAAWLGRVGSEWVGVHFDFGNNLSLCEDPVDTLKTLAPFAVACHLKDMAVEPYQDGFLLSEVALGEGILDLKAMIRTLQAKDPNIPLNLEMITRDPLQIPVFTRKYWATFDDSYSPLAGRDLARVLEIVRKNPPKHPLPRITGLSAAAQLRLEDECIARSIAYARRELNL